VLVGISAGRQLHQRRCGSGQARATDLPRLGQQELHASAPADDSRHIVAQSGRADNSAGNADDGQSCRLRENQGSSAGGILSGAGRLFRAEHVSYAVTGAKGEVAGYDVTLTVKSAPRLQQFPSSRP